jgi:Na+/H+ antiporter NhaC
MGLGLAAGLFELGQLLYIDHARFGARGLLVEGMERGVGASVFTILLMGLVGTIERSGLLGRLIDLAAERARTERAAEAWIVAALSAAVLLTTHSVVAIVTVGDFARRTGERLGIGAYRRANLLDLTACTYPFLLPFFIPTILAASTTVAAGMPRVSPAVAGLHNFYSWGVALMVAVAVATGYGRRERL